MENVVLKCVKEIFTKSLKDGTGRK